MSDTAAAPETIDAPNRRVLELDVDSLTIGELSLLERETGGETFTSLFSAGPASRRMLALWLDELRAPRSASSGPRRTWRELGSLPGLAVLRSTSLSPSAGPSPTSND